MHLTMLVSLALILFSAGSLAEASPRIRKPSTAVAAEIDGTRLRQDGRVVAELDGDRVRAPSTAVLLEFDGTRVRKPSTEVVAEIDGRYLRRDGRIVWEIESGGTIRKGGTMAYTVDDYSDAGTVKRLVIAFLLLFAE